MVDQNKACPGSTPMASSGGCWEERRVGSETESIAADTDTDTDTDTAIIDSSMTNGDGTVNDRSTSVDGVDGCGCSGCGDHDGGIRIIGLVLVPAGW